MSLQAAQVCIASVTEHPTAADLRNIGSMSTYAIE